MFNTKFKFLFSLVFLSLVFQNCGRVSFTAANQSLTAAVPDFNGDGPPGGLGNPTGGSGHGPTIVLPPGSISPAPAQTSEICNFTGIDKTVWDNLAPSAATNLPNYNISGQSGDIYLSAANQVSLTGNSGNSFIIENAELLTSFSGNSGNFVGNVRSFMKGSGNSGSIDLNSIKVGDITGSSAGHLCVWAQTINSVRGSSAGNISVVANNIGGAVGTLAQISGSSSGKLIVIDMNMNSISGGSGPMYLQGGHVQTISGQSGDIYLDALVVDQIIGSSGTIYLLNGAKVLN